MNQWNLASMYDTFVKDGITASTIWDVPSARLLELKLPESDQIRFRKAKEMMLGKDSNTSELAPAIHCFISFINTASTEAVNKYPYLFIADEEQQRKAGK